MSTANAPQKSVNGTDGSAFASKQSWSNSRGLFKMDLYPYPGVVLYDTFQNATGTWLGVGGSGAGTGLVNPSSTVCANNSASGKSLQVTANANSRYYAVRKFDITPAKKLGFNVFFCYDSPVNVAFINFEAVWKDVDHGVNHHAAYRYNTDLTRWEFLPNTATSPSGAWQALAGATSTMESGAGAWHELYFDANYNANTYDEFSSGQVGFFNGALGGNALFQPTELVEAQRMEIRLGVETTASGAGNAWFADVTSLEVD